MYVCLFSTERKRIALSFLFHESQYITENRSTKLSNSPNSCGLVASITESAKNCLVYGNHRSLAETI